LLFSLKLELFFCLSIHLFYGELSIFSSGSIFGSYFTGLNKRVSIFLVRNKSKELFNSHVCF